MALFIFILIVGFGLFSAYRLMWPEMYVSLNRPKFNFPWQQMRMREERVDLAPRHAPIVVDQLPPAFDVPLKQEEMPAELTVKIQKMDRLLNEKNKLIDRLQKELDALQSAAHEFENINTIKDEEINHLRAQIKSIKDYYKKENSNA